MRMVNLITASIQNFSLFPGSGSSNDHYVSNIRGDIQGLEKYKKLSD